MKIYRDIEDLELKNTVLTVGTFDGVHLGHMKLIERIQALARSHKAESTIITFHPHPRLVVSPDEKNLHLITTLREKTALLERAGIDNLVVVPFSKEFANMDANDYITGFLVKKFDPKVIVIGYDHRFGKGRAGNIDLLKSLQPKYRFELEEIGAEQLEDITISSTKIRDAILKGDVETGNNLLGYPFLISGEVVSGDRMGRELGFPTANIKIEEENKLIPAKGVYSVLVELKNGNTHRGILNVGNRPTFNHQHLQIEVHLFDFSAEIYGQQITLTLFHHIREEKAFSSPAELVAQIKLDIEKAKELLTP